MADIINLLPEYLANQIAAGEVVQRPASVVKELMENAVDAGGTNIQLIVKEAGKTLIQVVDNGMGMSPTDARMSFERHATSKIKSTEDLFRIRTMGFRGEALASIAAVAQVELKTKKRDADTGTRLVIEGSEVINQEPVAMPDGTNLCVKNLFFNVPARRNFLKSNAVEMRHILDEFTRIALAHPNIAFSLYQNDLEVFQLPAAKLSQRIVAIFGKSYKEQLAACEENTPFIKISGYVGKPEFAKKSRGEQFFFVNNRYIRNAYLNHAVLTAYEGLLPKDSFPFYVLFLEIDPESIDINVHPTKTEIKFDDEKTVYAIVRAAAKQSLGLNNIAPSLDFEGDVNFAPLRPVHTDFDFPPAPEAPVIPIHAFNPANNASSRNGTTEIRTSSFSMPRATITWPEPEKFNSQNEDIFADIFTEAPEPVPAAGSKAMQIHNKYLLVQVKSGVMMVDQQAAQERILYEKFYTALQKNKGISQTLLFPEVLSFSPTDFSIVQEMGEELKALGFVYNDFGKNTIVINAIPADVPPNREKELFEGLIEQYQNNRDELALDKKEAMARAMAKRVAARLVNRITESEINALVDKLFATQVPNYTPSGQKTLVMMDLNQLQHLFGKS
ncbi:DNA mismatch repair endonuclease MutL [Adhaeribacter rhizoryzae]|uniref:DNA mismatch repair protein MutL n=1 Tax=Adhaeribacter rhizoryzae TaxID=2607907 RepID=A0A5M6D4Q3_9BACT|nr:DNA mismatch repair endonuclease MutL [Adhaeribacter rhizoryzae]KAA5542471.1 DNA mismatch repair endonuclease MutL [Adhaeribacter rhizoryzae]